MKPLRLFAIIVIFIFFGLIIGCTTSADAPEEAEVPTQVVIELPTLAPSATFTPEPSSTPEPTDTVEPTPTPTPEPSNTPEPTPTQKPEILVLVADVLSGDPISGASVELSNNESGMIIIKPTGDEGQVRFSSLPAGDYSLTISAEGYYDERDEKVAISGSAETQFSMTELAMAEIMVESASLRAGPGNVYAREGAVEEGEAVEVVNQNEAGDWLLVAYGEDDETAWVSLEDVSVSGGLERAEVIEPPPTPTPAPTAAPQATDEPEVADTIYFYYLSNPNEILGVFPVRPFDSAEALAKMQIVRSALYTMRDALPGARSGDAAACASYVSAYNNVLYSGVYYDPVPPEWEDIDGVYYISFLYSLDRTRPAFLSCANAGRVDDFNAGLAEQAINQTLSLLEPAISEAAARQ